MTSAITFALISLAAAGCLDVTFKKFSLKERSRGMFVFGCGVVWLFLQLCYAEVSGTKLRFDETTLWYGLFTGALVALANILLIESLTGLDVSLGSMIYRLNTIGVVLISFFLLSEGLGAHKTLGICVGILGVALLYRRGVGAVAPVFFILAVGAATFRALYGVSTKYALEQGAAAEVMLIIAAVSWVIGGLLYAALRERRVRFTGKKAAYALISGTLCFAVVNTLIEALKLGEASIVVPVANLSFVVSMAISVVLGLETLGVRKYAAIGCAVVSVFLLSQAN